MNKDLDIQTWRTKKTMCEFFSCIIDKKGKVYWDVYDDSHEYLITKFNLDANNDEVDKYVRIEVNPADGNIFNHKINNWSIKIDEQIIPSWYERNQKTLYEKNIYKALQTCFQKNFIIKKNNVKLDDGIWFVFDSTISKLEENVLIRVLKKSTVQKMWDSSTVQEMGGFSTVQEMRGSSTVQEMLGSSIVQEMWDSSIVQKMRDSSTVITSQYNYNDIKKPSSKKNNAIFIDRKNKIIFVGHKKVKF